MKTNASMATTTMTQFLTHIFAKTLPTLRNICLIGTACFSLSSCETVKKIHIPFTHKAPEVVQEQPAPAPEPIQQPAYASIWEHIADGFRFPDADNAAIQEQIRWYTKNANYFSKNFNQAAPYLHYVVTQLEAENIPLELALLPFIESGFNPEAVSPGKNVGMWQLAPGTGRVYGLTQNSVYDGRKDIVASTRATIKMLKALEKRFDGDWLLVVAAYNAGEGNIQNAIEKNRRAGKSTNFWSLPLTQTTKGYIPQLYALSKIIRNPSVYRFDLPMIPDTPYFSLVTIDSAFNLNQLASKTNVSASELKRLNPGYSGWVIDPKHQSQILVPTQDSSLFENALSDLPQAELPTPQEASTHKGKSNTVKKTYVVKSGDNLWTIAKAQKTTAEKIAALNHLSKTDTLKPGQTIIISENSVNNQSVDGKTSSSKTAQPHKKASKKK